MKDNKDSNILLKLDEDKNTRLKNNNNNVSRDNYRSENYIHDHSFVEINHIFTLQDKIINTVLKCTTCEDVFCNECGKRISSMFFLPTHRCQYLFKEWLE